MKNGSDYFFHSISNTPLILPMLLEHKTLRFVMGGLVSVGY